MNVSFTDTLYFKDENILEIILGVHRTNKLIQQEILAEIEKNNVTFNEFLILLQIKKGFNRKIEISKKLFIKRQNVNIIFKSLYEKSLINKDNKISEQGEITQNKLIKKISERVKILFEKIEPRSMGGFISMLENL